MIWHIPFLSCLYVLQSFHTVELLHSSSCRHQQIAGDVEPPSLPVTPCSVNPSKTPQLSNFYSMIYSKFYNNFLGYGTHDYNPMLVSLHLEVQELKAIVCHKIFPTHFKKV